MKFKKTQSLTKLKKKMNVEKNIIINKPKLLK